MIGYWLQRSGCPGKMFVGVTPKEIANCIECELGGEEEQIADARDAITLTPFEVTQEEIDAMPEFGGW